jgi:peptidoglycan/LPS O-acetylase OafA/YrhL
MAKVSTSYRIASLDGLRAAAVLGVIWAHVWLFCGNQVWSLGKIGSIDLDLNRAISMVGTGVDLFFVISGFCMYLMYARKQTQFSLGNYATFLRNRWLRIAPAFYVSALVCAIGYNFLGKPFPWLDLLSHISFTHILFSNTGDLAAPFWSLATEWHFYIFLPLFVWAAKRWGFWAVITVSILVSIVFRTLVYAGSPEFHTMWDYQILMRLDEFAWGMCIAWLYTKEIMPPKILWAERGFLISIGIAYLGRVLMESEVVKLVGNFGYLFNIIAQSVLAFGYSLLLWNVVMTGSIFQELLSHSSVQLIGRSSYSLYLWHWWPCLWISQTTVKYIGATSFTQNITLALSLVLLIPFSYISYHLLEAPYFRKRHSQSTT